MSRDGRATIYHVTATDKDLTVACRDCIEESVEPYYTTLQSAGKLVDGASICDVCGNNNFGEEQVDTPTRFLMAWPF